MAKTKTSYSFQCMNSKSLFCYLAAMSLIFFSISVWAQAPNDLFESEEELILDFGFSFKEIHKSNEKSERFPVRIKFEENGTVDSVEAEVRARGNFRRDKCQLPPLKLRLKKKKRAGGIFENHKNLKLVLPCSESGDGDKLIRKEYLAYKLYEEVNPYFFKTRLVKLNITDFSNKKTKTYQLQGILIEDDQVVAKRFGGQLVKDLRLSPFRVQDSIGIRHDFFQMMIANTDWSTMAQHNITMMTLGQGKYVPLPYDFDMSGLVNAYYARVSELLPIKTVRQRLYRGVCWEESLFDHTREEFIRLQPAISEVMEKHEFLFDSKEMDRIRDYLNGFFEILHDDRKFKSEILDNCRK